MSRKPYELIKRPIVTEKTAPLAEQGVYAFSVARDASKDELKAAFELLFEGRKVKAVRTVKKGGYTKRVGARMGKVLDAKKAYFTVEGDPIELYAAG